MYIRHESMSDRTQRVPNRTFTLPALSLSEVPPSTLTPSKLTVEAVSALNRPYLTVPATALIEEAVSASASSLSTLMVLMFMLEAVSALSSAADALREPMLIVELVSLSASTVADERDATFTVELVSALSSTSPVAVIPASFTDEEVSQDTSRLFTANGWSTMILELSSASISRSVGTVILTTGLLFFLKKLLKELLEPFFSAVSLRVPLLTRAENFSITSGEAVTDKEPVAGPTVTNTSTHSASMASNELTFNCLVTGVLSFATHENAKSIITSGSSSRMIFILLRLLEISVFRYFTKILFI